jgi:hypothetical protein
MHIDIIIQANENVRHIHQGNKHNFSLGLSANVSHINSPYSKVQRTVIFPPTPCASPITKPSYLIPAFAPTAPTEKRCKHSCMGTSVGSLRSQTVDIVSEVPSIGTMQHGGQFPTVFPSKCPAIVCQRIADAIIGNGFTVVSN